MRRHAAGCATGKSPPTRRAAPGTPDCWSTLRAALPSRSLDTYSSASNTTCRDRTPTAADTRQRRLAINDLAISRSCSIVSAPCDTLDVSTHLHVMNFTSSNLRSRRMIFSCTMHAQHKRQGLGSLIGVALSRTHNSAMQNVVSVVIAALILNCKAGRTRLVCKKASAQCACRPRVAPALPTSARQNNCALRRRFADSLLRDAREDSYAATSLCSRSLPQAVLSTCTGIRRPCLYTYEYYR